MFPGADILFSGGIMSLTATIRINGEKLRKTFKSKKAKLEWVAKMNRRKDLVKAGVLKSAKEITVGDIANEYLSTRVQAKDGTRETYISIINKYVLPNFASFPIEDFRKAHLERLMLDMKKNKKAPSTINKVLVFFKCFFKHAVENELIQASPITTIKPLKVDKEVFQYWSKEEAGHFLREIRDEHYYYLFKFALNTGLRRGEICGLKWSNVAIKDGNVELEFNEQLLPGRVRNLVKGFTKRTVPLTQSAIDVLNDLKKNNPKKDDYIFLNRKGDPVEPTTLSVTFKKLQHKAGVSNVVKFHALRHSFASLLAKEGINIQKVAQLMGHKSSNITERYTHLGKSDLAETVLVVDFKESESDTKVSTEKNESSPQSFI